MKYIPLWTILFVGTSLFLLVDWLISLLVRKPKKEPYFKPRSIFTKD